MSLEALELWIEQHPGLWSIIVMAMTLAVSAVAYAFIRRLLRNWAKGTDSRLDDKTLELLDGPLRWLVPILGLTLIPPSLMQIDPHVNAVMRHVLIIVVIGLVAWLILRMLRVVELTINARTAKDNDDIQVRTVQTQVRGFRNIASFVIYVLAIAFMLLTFERVREVGVSLLASAGIAGIVVGFAAQHSIATIVAGIQVAFTQPIRVDDVVIVEGEWGRIEEITLTYVVVRIWDLRRLVVPMSYFIDKPFQNWTRGSPELLGTVFLYADYRMPVDAVRAELERLVKASEHWDGQSVGLVVTNADHHTMELRATVSAADSSKLWSLRTTVREKLIEFVQREYPAYLPRHRTELSPPLALVPSPTGAPLESNQAPDAAAPAPGRRSGA